MLGPGLSKDRACLLRSVCCCCAMSAFKHDGMPTRRAFAWAAASVWLATWAYLHAAGQLLIIVDTVLVLMLYEAAGE